MGISKRDQGRANHIQIGFLRNVKGSFAGISIPDGCNIHCAAGNVAVSTTDFKPSGNVDGASGLSKSTVVAC